MTKMGVSPSLYLEMLGYPPICIRELPDGRVAWIHRLMFTHALLVAHLPCESYEDRWCYQHREDAIRALQEWNPETEAEPTGWHRHPPSGRRRPGGDAAKEYVNL
jgi:hypothetical protein